MRSHKRPLPVLPQLKDVAGALNNIHKLSFSFLITNITESHSMPSESRSLRARASFPPLNLLKNTKRMALQLFLLLFILMMNRAYLIALQLRELDKNEWFGLQTKLQLMLVQLCTTALSTLREVLRLATAAATHIQHFRHTVTCGGLRCFLKHVACMTASTLHGSCPDILSSNACITAS
jgi:hypothetical protein